MTKIKAESLIAYAQNAVGGGYCWGADGQVCSPSVRQELASRTGNAETRYNLLNLCAKWDGQRVWDCSGLFRGAWRALLKYRSGGATGVGGNEGYDSTRCRGGAGAYCAGQDGVTLKGDYVVTIGAAQGASSFGTLLTAAAVSGPSGGTGGGGAGGYSYIDGTELARHSYNNQGAGDGLSKVPFGDTAAFAPHCAGGGAGGYYTPNNTAGGNHYTGGAGGTNGGSGNAGSSTEADPRYVSGGAGGDYGGGRGGTGDGNNSASSGTAATFYGSGGGGRGYQSGSYGTNSASGGAGYQGVVYIRIPA